MRYYNNKLPYREYYNDIRYQCRLIILFYQNHYMQFYMTRVLHDFKQHFLFPTSLV